MREMFKLFIVVALFSAISGGLLAKVKDFTSTKIDYNKLLYVQGPTIKSILEGCSNDPLSDIILLTDGEKKRKVFIGEFEGKRNTVAFETFGTGFGGDINVMVAVNLDTDEIIGIGVTTHSETPGLGSRTKTEPSFASQFKGLSINDPFKVKADDGEIDAVSGATISSRGVCAAVMDAADVYKRLKTEIMKQLKT